MLVDRIALVSNAHSLHGQEVAGYLARNGYFVLLGVVDEVKGKGVANAVRQHGGAEMVPLVATDPVSVCTLASYVEARYGRLDMLVSMIGARSRERSLPLEAETDFSRGIFDDVPFCDAILTLGFLPLLRKTPRAEAVRLCVPWFSTPARSTRSTAASSMRCWASLPG